MLYKCILNTLPQRTLFIKNTLTIRNHKSGSRIKGRASTIKKNTRLLSGNDNSPSPPTTTTARRNTTSYTKWRHKPRGASSHWTTQDRKQEYRCHRKSRTPSSNNALFSKKPDTPAGCKFRERLGLIVGLPRRQHWLLSR